MRGMRVQRHSRTCATTILVLIGMIMLSPPAAAEVLLTGAGATFPSPLYSQWFTQYATVDDGVRFEYQAIGSGGGVKRLVEQTVTFGASDAPMTEEQMKIAKGGEILHFPTTLGAVVLIYNLPQATSALKLTPL